MRLRGLKPASRRAQRRADASAMMTIEYALNGPGNRESTPAGVIIDGAVYRLQGEPPPAKAGIWFGHVAP
jgi:hypothetical protein